MAVAPLRLGYGVLSPPAGSAETPEGIQGYDVDAFGDFARSIGRRLEFVHVVSTATIPREQERSPFTGVLGAIENGSIFTYLDQNTITPNRLRAFEWILSMSVELANKILFFKLQSFPFNLYGGFVPDGVEDSSLSHFTVFAPSTLALIFVFVAIVNIPFLKFGSSTRLIANFFLINGIFLIVLFHGAIFQGNTAFPLKPLARNCEYYLGGLRSGSVGLIAVMGNTVKNHHREFLLSDPARLVINDDRSAVVELLCSPTMKHLAALTSYEFALLPKARSGCQLSMVDSSVLVDGKWQKYELFSQWTIVFLLPKDIPKPWLKKLKWLYNTLYSWENRLGILHRRFNNGRSTEQAKSDGKSPPVCSPFTLLRMSPIIYGFLVLLALSTVVFLAEVTLPMARVIRWLRVVRNRVARRLASYLEINFIDVPVR